VLLGATQQFTATVTNTTNTAVTWAVNGIASGSAQFGTIDANGLYRAPAILPSPAQVTVRATSVASPSSSGTATVTVTSDVVVSVAANPAPPVPDKVDIGFNQRFVASVTSAGGNPDRNVNWSLGGTGCGGAGDPCGTIDASGFYIAPQILPSPNSVTVTATSVADPSKSGSATISIDPRFTFTVTGPSSVDNATTAQYGAVATALPGTNANPSQAANWSVGGPPGGCTGPGLGTNQCGTIDLTGLYTAPTIAPSNPTVVITATSVADPTKGQSASVTINTVIIVVLSPTSPSVELEGTQQFTATVGGTSDQRVDWFVNGILGGDGEQIPGQVGTINSQTNGTPATYNAPDNLPGVGVTIMARSVADNTKTATTAVTLFSTISALLQPSGATRALERRVTLFGELTRTSTGSPPASGAVTWLVNGIAGGNATVGQICLVAASGCTPTQAGGVGNPSGDVDYLAPAVAQGVPPGGPVTIEMRSQADPSKTATAQVTVIPNILVSVSPSSSTLPTSETQQFTANVVGTSNTNVTWSVSGTGCGGNPCGAINASGLYTAPATVPSGAPPTDTVTATSADDPLRSGSGTVEIRTGPFIRNLFPASITALSGSSTAFTLKVRGSNFVLSTPGPGSTILFNGNNPLTTSCETSGTNIECTATITASSVASPGDYSVQIRNPAPGNELSNQQVLKVLDPATQQKDFASASVISLTTASPTQGCNDPPSPTDPGCQNITVVEPTTAGAPAGAAAQVNINSIGIFSGVACDLRGSPIAVQRGAAVDICLTGPNGLSTSYTYTISLPPGSPDITISNMQIAGTGVRMRLTISATAVLGPRTIFAETANREKAALVGAIEVR